jgi:RNA polymerase sigma-B factor
VAETETSVSKEKKSPFSISNYSQTELSELVRKYMPLVRQIARRYSQFNPDSMEDLVQVGSIGLLKACKYYDPNRARTASFKTLATCYIRGEIRHYLRDYCSLVQVPRKLTEMNAQLTQMEEKLTKQLARIPTTAELSAVSGFSVAEILEAQQSWEARIHYESFDAIGDDDDREDRRSLSDLMPDKKYQDWEHAKEERELVVQALKRLGERTREIVEFVFFYDLSQKETASVLGLSEMGVSRAVHSAVSKLRDMLKAEATR